MKLLFCIFYAILLSFLFLEMAGASYDSLKDRYENDEGFRFFTNLAIGALVVIILFVILGSFLGIELGTSFLTILGFLALLVIVFFAIIHYVGRSAQTMNPPPDGAMHRQSDGTIVWEGTYPAGYYNSRTGRYSKEPPADYVGEYDPEADRKYLYGQ